MGSSQFPEWSGPPYLNFWQGDPVKNILLEKWIRFPGSQKQYLAFALETDPDGASTTPSAPLPTGITLTGTRNQYVTYPGSGGTNGITTGIMFRVTDTRNGVHRSSPYTQIQIAGAVVLLPVQPSSCTAVAKALDQIEVSWVPGTGGSTPATYRIYRATTPTGPFVDPPLATDTASPYLDTGLAAGTKYYYCVAMQDTAGAVSAQSVVGEAMTFAGPPPIPVDVAAFGVDSTTIRVSWVAGVGTPAADHFVLYRSTSPSSGFVQISEPALSPYDDGGHTANQTFYYKVHCEDVSGVESADSAIVGATTLPLQKPGLPTALVVTPTGSSSLRVDWTPSTATPLATSFKVFRATIQSGPYSEIATDSASPYLDTARQPETTYWYRVAAIASGEESAQSVEESGTTYAALPSAPNSVVAVTQSTSEIRVTWAAPTVLGTPPVTYKLWVSNTGADGSFTELANNVTSPYAHTGLAESTRKYYRVSAIDAETDEGPRSANPPATAITDASAPAMPINVSASVQAPTAIRIQWEPGSGGSTPTHYRVYGSSSGTSGSFTQIAQVAAPTLLYDNVGLTTGVKRWYTVSAFDGTNESQKSLVVSATPVATSRNVIFTGDFETGAIQAATNNHDGFQIRTLPATQSNNEALITSDGYTNSNSTNAGTPTSPGPFDTKVVASISKGGETVLPRSGSKFLSTSIDFNKDYSTIDPNNSGTDPRGNPRLWHYLRHAHAVNFDVEFWYGMSIYLPLNFEHETGVRDDRGHNTLISINATTVATLLALQYYVQSPATTAKWYAETFDSATSTTESGGSERLIDLGSVTPDIGKWTDFIFRLRFNPFATTTNPGTAGIANAKNQIYQGNKGIMQIWKSEGAYVSGFNRQMVLKHNRVNVPVGLVPHKTNLIDIQPRQYKGAWHNNPTSITGEIWIGFDEIRYGQTLRDGTGYADVAPSGLGPPA
jgi:hypothetical protein